MAGLGVRRPPQGLSRAAQGRLLGGEAAAQAPFPVGFSDVRPLVGSGFSGAATTAGRAWPGPAREGLSLLYY